MGTVHKNDDLHVGDKNASKLSVVVSQTVVFHDFESLDHKCGDVTFSSAFSCHGYDWRLKIYPGGEVHQYNGFHSSNQKWISTYLELLPAKKTSSVKVKFGFKTTEGGSKKPSTYVFGKIAGEELTHGWISWIDRDRIASHLTDGALSLTVEIQVYGSLPLPTWSLGDWTTQKLPTRDLKAFQNGEYTDVTFSVGNLLIPAHRFIVAFQAPTTYTLIEDAEDAEVVQIDGVDDPELFRRMLEFAYSEDPSIASGNGVQCSKDLLLHANRFGVFKLKILLEDAIAQNHLNEESAIDLLIFADANDCALLYEAVISTILTNLRVYMKKEGWSDLKESMLLLNARCTCV